MPTETPPPTSDIPPDWTARHGLVAGLTGLSGRIRLRVGETEHGVLDIADGKAAIQPDGASAATLQADALETLLGLLGGEVHPIVARLQNRVQVEGDAGLVIRVFFGLRAGSPWSGLALRSQGHA